MAALLGMVLSVCTLGLASCPGSSTTNASARGGSGVVKFTCPAAGAYTIPVVATDTVTNVSTTTGLTVVAH